jgi:hypothetical protein
MMSATSDESSSARSSEDDDPLQAEPVLSDHDDDDFDDDLVRAPSSKSVFETMQLDLVLSEVALVTANVLHHEGAEREALAEGALPDCLQFSVRKLVLSHALVRATTAHAARCRSTARASVTCGPARSSSARFATC